MMYHQNVQSSLNINALKCLTCHRWLLYGALSLKLEKVLSYICMPKGYYYITTIS